MAIDPAQQWLLGVSIVVYVAVMYAIGFYAARQVTSAEDFIVAGRRLPLSLAWMTLLATWFGAGTLLTVADEVRAGGLRRAALDPLGAGTCLLLAALLVAGPMWRMKILTVPDFFRIKFSASAELTAAFILVPSYFGWIAAQFTAMAEVLELYFGLPMVVGILVVAIVGTGYTLLGGMWSVTLTDALQVVLLLVGLVVMAVVVLGELGNGSTAAGVARLATETDPDKLVLVPTSDLKVFFGWLGVFAIGALGNLPVQDLMQRIFSARSDRTAIWACAIAGVMYLLFGAIPLGLALAGNLIFPEETKLKILPALASLFLHPAVAVVFIVTLLSAILSTIDSAILSPASVLAQNVFPRLGWTDSLRSNRIAVLLISSCSVMLALFGSSAYELLEESYALTMVGLLVPLLMGIYGPPTSGRPAIVSMIVGVGLWALHFACGWEFFLAPVPGIGKAELPVSLTVTGWALVAYVVVQMATTAARRVDEETPK